ncbi:MAG TPA: TonB-dependent receptor, partial [Rariglobus sp.]
ALTPVLEVGVTFRGQDAENEVVGSRLYYAPGFVESANYLGTVYADWKASETVTSHFTAALHRREYLWSDAYGDSEQTNNRRIFDWQTAWKPADALELVVGANYETSDFTISGEESEEEIAAGFVSGTYRITDTLTLTAGLRYDDYDTVGSSTTWRTGLAWMVLPATKLRATYGTGFAAPGSSDRYGVPAWGQVANPNIKPEESKGWDVGVDQSFFGGALTFDATYFDNTFKELIDWEYINFVTYEGWYTNRSRASTDGVELGVTARPQSWLHLRAGYTYLNAEDDLTGQRLIRRPRHTFDSQIWADATREWTLGFGVHVVADRMEDLGPGEDYTTVRFFTSYELRHNITLKLRVENLLDEEYEEVVGYAALPRGVFGSVEWRF